MREVRLVVILFLIFTGSAAWAGRPLTIDNADPSEQGTFEFEMGVEYESDSSCNHAEFPFGLSYGLLPDVSIGASFGGQIEERNEEVGNDRACGLGDFEINAKWRFFNETDLCPAMALAAAVKFPTADDDKGLGSGEIDYDLSWIVSKSLTDMIGGHVNVGYTWVGQPGGEDVGDIVHYGAALEVQGNDAMQWVGEVFAEKELQKDTQMLVLCNVGLRWSLSENLMLDMAVGTGLNGDVAPDITATAGLTWAFNL